MTDNLMLTLSLVAQLLSGFSDEKAQKATKILLIISDLWSKNTLTNEYLEKLTATINVMVNQNREPSDAEWDEVMAIAQDNHEAIQSVDLGGSNEN